MHAAWLTAGRRYAQGLQPLAAGTPGRPATHAATTAVRSRAVVALAVAVVAALIGQEAQAAVYTTAVYRWSSSLGINEPIQPDDILQWSHCDTDGWTAASNSCVRRYFGAWNGQSEYYITDGTYSPVTTVDWGVGDVGGGTTLAITRWNTLDQWWTDGSGRQVQEVWGSWVILARHKRWQDDYGNLQSAVASWDGAPTYYRIDYVTVHEAGHVWGCHDFDGDMGHSPNAGDVMYRLYPHNNGVLSQNDIDTIRDLYNARHFG